MAPFHVAVGGDTGTDVFTRTISGHVPDGDQDLYPEIAYDLDVPCGAKLHWYMLHALLDEQAFSFEDWIPEDDTLPNSLQYLDSYEWNGRLVYRIRRTAPRRRLDWKLPEKVQLPPFKGPIDCAVIHDASKAWRSCPDAAERLRTYLQASPKNVSSAPPKVIALVGGHIPAVPIDKVDEDNQSPCRGANAVWDELRRWPEEVAIVCSVTSLRHGGAALSRRLSWEQTIDDVVAELQLFEPLRALSQFRDLIIRFGYVGFLHLQKNFQTGDHTARLIFAPSSKDGVFRDRDADGRIVGRKSMLAACLLQQMREVKSGISSRGTWNTSNVIDAIKTSLVLGMESYEQGFGCPTEFQKPFVLEGDPKTELATRFIDNFLAWKKKPANGEAMDVNVREFVRLGYDQLLKDGCIDHASMLGVVDVTDVVTGSLANVSQARPWQILRKQIRYGSMSRINTGIAICKFGHERVINRELDEKIYADKATQDEIKEIARVLEVPECLLSANEPHDFESLEANVRPALPYATSYRPKQLPKKASLFVPVMEFGKLVAIDRTDIESFRSIRNLMKTYVEKKGEMGLSSRPMSIAVFGQPGSGKSFAVKQIAQSINDGIHTKRGRLKSLECNVAQFRTVDDLGQVVRRVASINNQGDIPLVFLDEFDCDCGSESLGWLKYLLAPMQDGTFYDASQTISFGRAIFVLAGGIYPTIDAFDAFAEPVSGADPDKLEARLARRKSFQQQKGPDFISRLRGHINIGSVNPDESSDKDDSGKPTKPIIRRALIIRSHLLTEKMYVKDSACEVARIDEDILYALLTVDNYRHGARSIEAILQMCTPLDGIIEKTSLPSRAQLNMHVDADEFLVRVQRGRFRTYLARPQAQAFQTVSECVEWNQEDKAMQSAQNDRDASAEHSTGLPRVLTSKRGKPILPSKNPVTARRKRRAKRGQGPHTS